VREITSWPAIVNLRADPYEKMMFEAEMGYMRWYADNMWIFVPIQGVIKDFLTTIPGLPVPEREQSEVRPASTTASSKKWKP
jgi:hypothetical protein